MPALISRSLGRLRHSDVLVGAAIVEEVTFTAIKRAFDEHDIWNLPNLFPFLLRSKGRLFAPVEDLARIFAIEDCHCGTVDEFVVGPVVDEDDALWCQDRRGTRLDDARVKLSGPSMQHGYLRGLSPVNQVSGIRQSHLVVLV